MLLVRKIDLIGQAVLVGLCLMLCVASPIIAAAGYFLLGCWQVLSAACNTWAMTNGPFRKKILAYWLVTALDLSLIVLNNEYIYGAMMIIAGGIAIYYWITYRSFISYLTHRKELSAIVR